jgi:3-isopropylmalate/(R)-2-methylmalate dehydratase large subunit
LSQPQTIIDKLWSAHEIVRRDDGESLLWVDRHYVHEGSFHAFGKLAERRAAVAEPALTFGVADHYVPTRGSRRNIANPELARMVRQLEENCAKHRIKLFGLDDPRQGIVHVVGPEQGLTLPDLLIVCGDSHTSSHGALGAYAFGIGASEVAHVLMTQTIWQKKPKRMRVSVDGVLLPGVSAKDIVLAIIASIGADGATGCAVEFAGSAIRALSMEGRLTLCNMSIEAGARCGVVAPDAVTVAYLQGKPYAPSGAAFEQAVEAWSKLASDQGAAFEHEIKLDAELMPAHPIRPGSPIPSAPSMFAKRSTTWASLQEKGSPTLPSIGCLSAPAPTLVSKICARRQRCWRAAPARCPDWFRPGPRWSSVRPRAKGSTVSSATLDLNGANPVARCVSASMAMW